MSKKLEVSKIEYLGPSCHQALIKITERMVRDEIELRAFESFLKNIGVSVEHRDGSRGMRVFLNPQYSEDQIKKILEFER